MSKALSEGAVARQFTLDLQIIKLNALSPTGPQWALKPILT